MAKRERLSARWALLTLMGLSVLTAASGRPFSRSLRNAFRFIIIPVADVSMHITTAFRRSLGGLDTGELTVEQAEALKRHKRFLQQEVVSLHQLATDLQRRVRELENFEEVFGPARNIPCVLIPARVVASESLHYGGGRIVSAGSRQGVRGGDLVTTRYLMTDRQKALGKFNVLASNALVGRLDSEETGEYAARLILITHRNFKISAFIKRDLAVPRKIPDDDSDRMVPLTKKNNKLLPGEAIGDGEASVIIRGIEADQDVRPGDSVSVLPGTILPASVPLGTVTKVIDDEKAKKAGFKKLIVTPAVDLAGLRDVYIIYAPRLSGGRR
ncbi:MAG: rod shape-determining protein MreC [Planctomycetota bacterium]|jgi:cell shape-determining protein MreC